MKVLSRLLKFFLLLFLLPLPLPPQLPTPSPSSVHNLGCFLFVLICLVCLFGRGGGGGGVVAVVVFFYFEAIILFLATLVCQSTENLHTRLLLEHTKINVSEVERRLQIRLF